MKPTPQEFMEAARVPASLAEQEFGLWTITRAHVDSRVRQLLQEAGDFEIGWPSLTMLWRLSMATMHRPPGEIVMEDSATELRRHLPIWMAGRGRVLVTGLGLGCVVRGLLLSPDVDQVDVVEIDPDIIDAVGAEFAGDSRVRIYRGDALAVEWPEGARWDAAWHDLWVDGDGLQDLHLKLMAKYRKRTRYQGAWAFPRVAKRHAREALPGFIG